MAVGHGAIGGGRRHIDARSSAVRLCDLAQDRVGVAGSQDVEQAHDQDEDGGHRLK